jgi:hypothetical protein
MHAPASIASSLDDLCADREIETSEIFEGNAYYGIDHILKNYAGLPQGYALKGVWPHGLVFNQSHLWSAEVGARLPAAFCYPEYRAPAYHRQTNKRVILSASPFLYALDQIEQPDEERAGTLFFPAHSTHHLTAEMNFEVLADRLEELDETYKPVTVCIYWKDYLMGRHEIFAHRGFPIVSAGHMFDNSFLHRLARLLSRFQYAAGNHIGSHLFYAVKAGCRYFHIEGSEYQLDSDDEELLERDRSNHDPALEKEIRNTFLASKPRPHADQLRVADFFLGAKHKKSRAGLRADILKAELWDKTAIPRGNRQRLAHHLPTYWQRSLVSPLAKAKHAILGS